MLYAKPKKIIVMKKLVIALLSLSFLFSCKPEPQPLTDAEKATIKVAVIGGMYLAKEIAKKEKQDTVKYPSGPSFRYEE